MPIFSEHGDVSSKPLPWKQQATMEAIGIREQTEHIAGEASEQQCLMPLWWERTLHTIIH